MTTALTLPEAATLRECEMYIDTGLAQFLVVGTALARIRDERLYRANYDTFEDYCQTKWNMSRQYVNRIVAAAEVVDDLETIVSKPANEAQAKPLAKLPREERAAVWMEAVETSPKDADGKPKITAKHVEKVVAAKLDRPAKVEPQSADECPHGGEHEWATDDRGDQYCAMCYEDRPPEMCKPKPEIGRASCRERVLREV